MARALPSSKKTRFINMKKITLKTMARLPNFAQ